MHAPRAWSPAGSSKVGAAAVVQLAPRDQRSDERVGARAEWQRGGGDTHVADRSGYPLGHTLAGARIELDLAWRLDDLVDQRCSQRGSIAVGRDVRGKLGRVADRQQRKAVEALGSRSGSTSKKIVIEDSGVVA